MIDRTEEERPLDLVRNEARAAMFPPKPLSEQISESLKTIREQSTALEEIAKISKAFEVMEIDFGNLKLRFAQALKSLVK